MLVERRTTLAADHLSLQYRLVNVGEGPVPVFWMAHPLFDAAELVAVTMSSPGVAIECTVSSLANCRVGPAGAAPLLPSRARTGRVPQVPPRRRRRCHVGDAGALRRPPPDRRAGARDVPLHVQWWVDNAGIGPAPVVAP